MGETENYLTYPAPSAADRGVYSLYSLPLPFPSSGARSRSTEREVRAVSPRQRARRHSRPEECIVSSSTVVL